MRAIGVRASAAALAFVVFLAAFAGVPAQGGELDSLEIVTSTGRHAFQVEIANNDATREHGLMDRRYMAADHGMLFEFDREAPVVVLDEEHLHPARHDLHCALRRRDAHRRQRRAAVRARHSFRRTLRRGARIERRDSGFDRAQGGRQSSPSVLQTVTCAQARCIRRQDRYTRCDKARGLRKAARGGVGVV